MMRWVREREEDGGRGRVKERGRGRETGEGRGRVKEGGGEGTEGERDNLC